MISSSHPFIVAGPCSAESEKQVTEIAGILKSSGKVDIFRAGVWKPRTMPDTYEGPGTVALSWLQKIQKQLNFPVATEVANTTHIEAALKHDINILWIGARTTVNPFSMKEIASALKGTETTVLIKNPINADIMLWIGALERIRKVGIKKIMLVHRGFTSLNPSPYRYDPIWKIPIEMNKRFPEIPILCDPSHIAGDAQFIESISQKALDLNMLGLMIEVHANPSEALVDQKQQISPERFFAILEHLIKRKENTDNLTYHHRLEELRNQIDQIDHAILHHLAHRKEVVKEIAKLKFDNNIGPFQLDRFQELSRERAAFGKQLGLSDEMVQEIFTTVHEDAVKYQSDLMESFKNV